MLGKEITFDQAKSLSGKTVRLLDPKDSGEPRTIEVIRVLPAGGISDARFRLETLWRIKVSVWPDTHVDIIA
ncbi:hypothetical protein HQ544_02490 [Candidatus Falkowbacteria bacterium]|nr:hypothetical protein [Candidatus Falkowbacteria bacterium]